MVRAVLATQAITDTGVEAAYTAANADGFGGDGGDSVMLHVVNGDVDTAVTALGAGAMMSVVELTEQRVDACKRVGPARAEVLVVDEGTQPFEVGAGPSARLVGERQLDGGRGIVRHRDGA